MAKIWRKVIHFWIGDLIAEFSLEKDCDRYTGMTITSSSEGQLISCLIAKVA